MRKWKKLVAVVTLASLMAATVGCGSDGGQGESNVESNAVPESTEEASTGQEELPFVTLRALFPGDELEDAALVYEEKLKELTERDGLNCNIEIDYVSWGDYDTQYLLQLASGTPYDIVHISGDNYYNEARKGAFREITMEEIQTYMPETYAATPEDAWDILSVDGKNYYIPWYAGTVDQYYEFGIRTDKAEELGITVTDVDSLEAYMAAIKAADESEIPIKGAYETFEAVLYDQYYGYGTTPLSYLKIAPDGNGSLDYDNVVLKYETDDYLEYAKRVRTWQEAGYIERNAPSSTNVDTFSAGTSDVLLGNLGYLSMNILTLTTNDSSAKAGIVDVTPNATKYASGYAGNGYAISKNAENPERAMMLLDKLKNDREYHDLTFIGIEGVHYNNVEGDDDLLYYEQTDANAKFPKFGTAMWGWYNKQWARYGTGDLEEYVELDYSFENNAQVSKIAGFSFDNTNVQAEVAAVESVVSQYETILNYGMEADVEGTIANFMKALDSAGINEIKEEFMSQYNSYMEMFK